MIIEGYKVKEFQGPVKRFCRTMDLKNDAALIAEYVHPVNCANMFNAA